MSLFKTGHLDLRVQPALYSVYRSPQPHEIYQNLSPFMGSGFLSTPVLPPKGKIYSKIKRERAIIQFKLIYLILRLADLSFRFVVPGFDPHQEQLLKLRNH